MTLTQDEFYRQFLADGMPEDTAEILSIEAASGAFMEAPTTPRVTDEQIAAVEAAVAASVCTLSGRWGCSLGAGHDGGCIKTCVNHFWRRTGEGSESCGIEPARARYGHLCGPCFGRARRNLRDTIDILAFIRTQVPPAMESARGPRVSGTREAPIPLNAQAVEDSHDLFQRVNEWMAQFAESLGVDPSLTTLTWARRAGERLPDFWADELGATLAMENLVGWYENHEHSIVTALPPLTVKAWTEDASDITREFRARYKLTEEKPRRVSPRPCPTCGVKGVRAEMLFNLVLDVECGHCGDRIDARDHQEDYAAAEHVASVAISLACDRRKHNQCAWVDCPCTCHTERTAA